MADISRRQFGGIAAGLAAWFATKTEATAQTAPARPAAIAPTAWQTFQRHSQIEGVYTNAQGTYVVMVPKGETGRGDWWNILGEDLNLTGFIERNSDDVAAIFYLKDGREPLIAQNIVGFNTIFDPDYDAKPATPDGSLPSKFPELAKRNEGYTVLNMLAVRNILSSYDYDINDYDGAPFVDFAPLAHTLSFNARDAFVTCADGEETKFVRNAARERELKAKLAKGELQLANLVPDGFAYDKGAFIDKATGNIHLITAGVQNEQLLFHTIDPSGKHTAQALAVAGQRRGVLNQGVQSGYNNFFKTADGTTVTLFENGGNYSAASIGLPQARQRNRLTKLEHDDPMLAKIADVKLVFEGKPVVLAIRGAIKNNPAVVRLENGCPARPLRPVRTPESRGWEIRHSNNGG